MCSQLRIHSVLSMKLLTTSAQGVYAPMGHLEPTPLRRSWGVTVGRDHDLVRFEPNTVAAGRSRQRSDFLLLWLIKSFSRGGLGHLAAQG